MKKVIKNKKFQDNAGEQEQNFLAGGGELGELIRAKDWSGTSLGPIENWPNSLKTIVRIMLTSQQPIWVGWGPELLKLYNDPYKSIVGGKHPQALGQPASVVWSDIWKDIEPLLRQVTEKNQGTYSESQLLIMERNGYPEETYYTFSYSPVPGSKGGVGGIICVNTDDTQRVIGERQLASLRELAVLTADAKTVDEACTLSAAALQANAKDIPFGMIYRVEQTKKTATLAGAIGIDKMHAAVPEKIALDSNSIWPVSKVVENREICIVSDLGKYFNHLPKGSWDQPPHQAVVVPITKSSHAGTIGVMIVGLNPYRLFDDNYRRFLHLVSGQIASSTVNAQAYEEEKRRAEALAEIDRAKTLFFSNVSHEFRTPLTLMLGPVQDLLNEPLDADQRKHLEVVHRNGLRLKKLVNTLLDFSRIEAGRVQANYTPTNLATYTAELASNFRSAIEKSGMRLIVNTPQLSEHIYVDRDMWEKIVLNLLSNAFKFTFEGEIEVGLVENQMHVTLIVRDTGEGISPQDLLHIFERFKRVEGAKSRTFEGTGIGLSLVQELVKLHSGAVNVESTVGKGTTFYIKIPKGTQHLPKDHAPTLQSTATGAKVYIEELEQWLPIEEKLIETDQQHDGLQAQPEMMDKPRIVLADDNADMRNYVQRLLASRFDVKVTSNGKEALQVIQEKTPDLLLTDVMMPEMDGFALVKALKAKPQTALVPVIMLSARAGEEAKVDGLEAGADDYLAKPFSANELVARVNTLIAANRAKREAENHLYELFMQAPAIITVLRGPEFIFELANPLYMQLVGKDRDIIGKPVVEALPEVKAQGFIELLDNVYKTGEPFIGNEIPAKLDRHGNGKLEEAYLNFVYHPYKDNKGSPQGIFVHGVEVTEQVRARQVIQENERFLQTLISNLPGMVYRYPNEKPWPLEFASEGVYELSGQQPEDFTHRKIHWVDLIHPDDIERIRNQVSEALEKKEIFTLVYRIKTRQGKEKWIWDRGQGVYDVNGNLLFIEGFATDITERKRAEEALEQSKNLITLINDAIPAFISYIDLKQQYQFVNQAYEKWFGVSKDRVRGKTVAEILGEEAYQNSVPVIKKVLSGEVVTYENTLKKNGEVKHLQVDYVPDISDNGSVRGFVVLGHDITERKKAEEELRYHATISQNIADAVVGTDLEYRIKSWNKGAEKLYGWKAEEVIGKLAREIIPTEFLHPDTSIDWQRSLAENGFWKGEIIQKRKDGMAVPVLASIAYVKDNEGKPVGAVAVNRDITDRKQAEEALRKSEMLFKTYSEALPQMAFIADAGGSIIYYNQRWYDYVAGMKGTEGWGWKDKQIHHPDDLQRTIDRWSYSLRTGEPYEIEYRLRRYDGEYRWHLSRAVPVHDHQGKVELWLGTNTDIHEQKQAEEALKKSEEFNRTLLESSPDCIKALDLRGALLSMNRQGQVMMEIDDFSSMIGIDWTSLWSGEYSRLAKAAFEKARKGDIGHFQGFRSTVKGTPKWWDVLVAPVYGTDNKVERLVSVSRDITQLKELERQKDDFIGIASHELKTPVTSIKGSIQIIDRLFKDKSYEMIGNFLTKAAFHVDKLTGLINDLLDVSKIQAGKLQYNFSECTARDIIEDCVEQVSHQAKKHKIIVQGDMSVAVYGDKVRLEQVVSNLLTNAIKYSPEADEVILEVSKANGILKISVSDFGIGIPEEIQSHVFDRFFRVEKSSHQFQGLGIGLYICAEIVKRHGGNIGVESTEGKGSTFYFTLPLNQSSPMKNSYNSY